MSLRSGTGSRETPAMKLEALSKRRLLMLEHFSREQQPGGRRAARRPRHGRGSQAEAVDQDGATRRSARRASQSHDPARQRCVPRAVTPPPRPASLGLPSRCDPPETPSPSRLVRHSNNGIKKFDIRSSPSPPRRAQCRSPRRTGYAPRAPRASWGLSSTTTARSSTAPRPADGGSGRRGRSPPRTKPRE